MTIDLKHRDGSVKIGPPGGPHVSIPDHYVITITAEPPYDLVLDVTWDEEQGRHTLHELKITEQPGGDYVRMSKINQIALSDMIERCLVADVVGGARGWAKLVEHHADAEPMAVDALIYLLSHALGGQSPAATVALARGLSQASGPRRVSNARRAGLIPPATEQGKAAG